MLTSVRLVRCKLICLALMLLVFFAATTAFGENAAINNLALQALGARARSWEPGVPVVPGHEPARANDGSVHTYWLARPENLPADLGIEWEKPQEISSVIVRYFDGHMVAGPGVARTQQSALLQYWDGDNWRNIDARLFGQETSTVRYVFAAVKTTRVRILYTEPPDAEFRRTPEQLGIYVCEFEAYREAPFQWVASEADRVVRIKRENPDYYNPALQGDSGFDLQRPLIIEPVQTRIFAGTVAPTLSVEDTPWAKGPCATTKLGTHAFRLSNGFLRLDIAVEGELRETNLANLITGESLALPHSNGFSIYTSEGDFTSKDFKVVGSETTSTEARTSGLSVELQNTKLAVTVHYELRQQEHFYHKWMTVTNRMGTPLDVRDVTISDLGLPGLIDLPAGLELTYPIYRGKEGGFFECLETMYWDHQQDALTYYPGKTLAPSANLATEKAAVGVYKRQGDIVAGWDAGIRGWVAQYHRLISPPPEQWPDVYCEGWSADLGAKQLLERPQWVERQFATAERLGIRYMDGYEPIHQVMAMPAAWSKAWVDLANRHHIATGWWPDFGSGSDWGTGKPFMPFASLTSPEAKLYLQNMEGFITKYQLKGMHWGDFMEILPAQNPGPGVLPGKYSIYAQGQEIINFNLDLHKLSPGIMLGGDCALTSPQFVRYDDDRANCFFMGYYGDFLPAVEPDIHLDRLYGDMMRQYVYGAHELYLLPWHRIFNGVNHMGLVTHQHDRAGFRYSLLSALAMAGQVAFNDIPEDIPESEIEFEQHWLGWAKANKEYLGQGNKLFDHSIHAEDLRKGDAYSLSGFTHIVKDRGYIFLLNPTPVPQLAELKLAMGVAPATRFIVKEVYPGDGALESSASGGYVEDSELTVTVQGKQVRILWIAPATNSMPQSPKPENVRIPDAERYLGNWTVVAHTPESATLSSQFEFPASGIGFLSGAISASAWSKEPWAYDKGYLVFLLKDESRAQNDDYVSDDLQPVGATTGNVVTDVPAVSINGVSKTLYPFEVTTGLQVERNQVSGLARCFFVDLEGETKPGQPNEVKITLPFRNDLVFEGAYLDLPDQMP